MKTQRPWTAKVILRKKNSAGGFRYLTWDCTTKLQKDIFELSLNNPFTNRTFLQMKLLPASAEWNFSFSSVQFSRSVVSDSLRPRELQHARPPCPSQTPGVHPDSRPSSQWCHPAISSSVVPFSSCPQSLPAAESFPMSQLRMRWPKYWSFSFSIIPSKEIPGLISFRMDWLDLFA